MVALGRDDMDQLYEHTTRVSEYLGHMPGHWLWAAYRLVVATLLAKVAAGEIGELSGSSVEIAEKAGIPGYLIDGPEDMRREWFDGKACVGVTAGASAPELLVKRVVWKLEEWGGAVTEEVAGRPENVVFTLPKQLRAV